MVRCLTKDANLDSQMAQRIWSLIIKQAHFIQNRIPSSSTNAILLNVFYEDQQKAYLKHIRRFGALVWMHNPQMPKLDSRASKMMLVGQSEKAFLLFDPINSKIFLSRNVKILEDLNYYKEPTESNHLNANATIKTSQEEIPRDYTESLVSSHKDK